MHILVPLNILNSVFVVTISLPVLRSVNSNIFVGSFTTAPTSFFTSTCKVRSTSSRNSFNRAFYNNHPRIINNRRFVTRSEFAQNLRSSSNSLDFLEGDNLNKLTVVQIKEILRAEGLKLSGRKVDLIERLIQHKGNNNISEIKELIVVEEDIMPRTSPRKRNNDKSNSAKNEQDESKDQELPQPNEANVSKSDIETTPKAKKAKVESQRITDRDELNKLWNAEKALQKGSYTFKIMSWNVAGLRALIRKEPNALSKLAAEHDLDVICLQETKLQESHLDDPKLKIKALLADDGYASHFSCSTAKKGYSGTCVFIKQRKDTKNGDDNGGNSSSKVQGKLDKFFVKKESCKVENSSNDAKSSDIGDIDVKDLIPLSVSMNMGKDEHDSEGRIITSEYPKFVISNLYVPNSGQNLERLTYRTKSWDKDLLHHMKELEETRNKPVIWLGDLNVAHTWQDCWNDGAKHLVKQAGTTPEERESFQQMLDNGNFVDAFRFLYPDAKGHYTYWSQRAGNRGPNKGLRLDYFICSSSLMNDEGENNGVVIRDSYMIPDQNGSDHCPVVLEMELRK